MNAASWAQRIHRLTSGNGLQAQLLRGGAGSLAVKAAHAVLAFALAVVLARTLGPEGYGAYSFALAIIMLTAIPAQVGVPQLVVRETAKTQANGSYELMRGLWRWGNLAVLLFSALSLAAVGGIVWFTDIGGDGARVATLTIGIALIPIIALANVRGACLRGLRKVVQGQLPESIIRPALLLLFVLVWGTWFVEDELTPQMAMGFYVLAAVFAFIVGAWLLRRSRPAELGERPPPEYQSSAWRKAVIPLAMIGGLQIVNKHSDLIILGIFRPDDEVGIYRAVFQMSLLVAFGLQALNQVLQPHFARLLSLNARDHLQRLLTFSSRTVFFLAMIPFFLFMGYGESLLILLFGKEYSLGYVPLLILALGQVLSAFFGSVTALLTMGHYEKAVWRVYFLVTILNVILNFILVPNLGMVGAAMSTTFSIMFSNIILNRLVSGKLGYQTSAFFVSRKKFYG